MNIIKSSVKKFGGPTNHTTSWLSGKLLEF